VAERLERMRRLYQQAGVFEKAFALVDKYQERAAALADSIAPAELQRLLHYLIETVLEHSTSPVSAFAETGDLHRAVRAEKERRP